MIDLKGVHVFFFKKKNQNSYWRKEEHLNQFRQQLHEDSREGVRRDSVVRPNSRISIFKKKDDFPLVKVPESIEESKSGLVSFLLFHFSFSFFFKEKVKDSK